MVLNPEPQRREEVSNAIITATLDTDNFSDLERSVYFPQNDTLARNARHIASARTENNGPVEIKSMNAGDIHRQTRK